ncbi:DoxX family protein [Aeromicrobium choanae]|uniref:DoxX-like family protein n=1 Tax=Aeromicrobium choanae TaxID=1736691 RepID=A0A1T4Z274_9ACTN|nr:DoxX family protein [Aeromicrobium choanae]SKB08147.1 DoxX-like family protein [Aeromicrobium choanae]
MTTHTHTRPATGPTSGTAFGPRAQRAGWVVTALVTAFLGFDAVTHLLQVEQVREASAGLGIPDHVIVICGAVLGSLVIGYLVPATRAMAVVLITAYLGGAVAVNLIAEQPALNSVFAILAAVLVWAGAWPRDARLRGLLRA